MSPILADEFFTTEPLGKPMLFRVHSERQGSPQHLWLEQEEGAVLGAPRSQAPC